MTMILQRSGREIERPQAAHSYRFPGCRSFGRRRRATHGSWWRCSTGRWTVVTGRSRGRTARGDRGRRARRRGSGQLRDATRDGRGEPDLRPARARRPRPRDGAGLPGTDRADLRRRQVPARPPVPAGLLAARTGAGDSAGGGARGVHYQHQRRAVRAGRLGRACPGQCRGAGDPARSDGRGGGRQRWVRVHARPGRAAGRTGRGRDG